jgi:D-glycero-D-manno-heptose 1,7-bisphosphate phosphatase
MKHKYIILDRDGTLIKHVPYLIRIEDIEFLPGVFQGLSKLKKMGYKFGIVTNQSLIGRNFAKKLDVDRINSYILECMKSYEINIDFVYICPHAPSQKCACRKPDIQLGLKAIENFSINTGLSYMIGDAMSDIQFGINLGLRTIQINPLDFVHTEAGFVTDNMLVAAEWVLNNA